MRFFKKYFIDSLFFSFPAYIFLLAFLIPATLLDEYFFNIGIALRFLGFLLIIYGIDKKLKKFTNGGIKRLFINWWRGKSVVLKPDPIVVETSMGEGRVKVNRNFDDSSIDDKINFLLDYVEKLDDKIWETRKDFRNDLNKLNRDLKNFKKELSNKIESTKSSMKGGFIGNVKMEFSGALAIIFGLIISSYSGGFSDLVNWLRALFV